MHTPTHSQSLNNLRIRWSVRSSNEWQPKWCHLHTHTHTTPCHKMANGMSFRHTHYRHRMFYLINSHSATCHRRCSISLANVCGTIESHRNPVDVSIYVLSNTFECDDDSGGVCAFVFKLRIFIYGRTWNHYSIEPYVVRRMRRTRDRTNRMKNFWRKYNV